MCGRARRRLGCTDPCRGRPALQVHADAPRRWLWVPAGALPSHAATRLRSSTPSQAGVAAAPPEGATVGAGATAGLARQARPATPAATTPLRHFVRLAGRGSIVQPRASLGQAGWGRQGGGLPRKRRLQVAPPWQPAVAFMYAQCTWAGKPGFALSSARRQELGSHVIAGSSHAECVHARVLGDIARARIDLADAGLCGR